MRQRWRKLNLFLVVTCAAVSLCQPVMGAEEPAPGKLTPSEIDYLVQSCPEVNQVISSGVVVAYGEIIEPPLLVTILWDYKVYLNGIEVFPRPARRPTYLAEKVLYRIQEQYLREKRKGGRDALGAAQSRAKTLADREKAHISFPKKKGIQGETQWVEVAVESNRWKTRLDACPSTLMRKNRFLLSSLSSTYSLRKQSQGKDTALSWLTAGLDDLRRRGALDSYRLKPERETADIKWGCEPFEGTWAFYDSPYREEQGDEERRKIREESAAIELKRIQTELRNDSLIVLSFGFDRAIPADIEVLAAMRKISEGADSSASRDLLRTKLKLTDVELKGVVEELR